MTKRKSTKSALISSVLALFLCFTMLIGTTFAWFTDSVTSSGNKIVAGTLDVDLYLWNSADEATEITNESAPIFGGENSVAAQNNAADTLWEPGKTQVAYLSIKNNGSLDLKYKVTLEVYDVKNNLIDVLEYAITPDAKFDDVKEWAGEGIKVNEGTNATASEDVALKAGDEHFFALSIHMDENAGNEYQDGSATFDVKVLATQLASENDSFDNQYDKDSTYALSVSTADELIEALAQGGNIALANDITLDGSASISIEEGVAVEMDLNGYTLTNAVAGAPALINNGTLTINGENGAIENGTSAQNKSHTIRNFGTLIVNGGTIGTEETAGAAIVNDGTVTINGGTFASKQEDAKSDGLCAYVFINNGTGTMTINDATVNAETHGLFGAYNGRLIVNGGSYTLNGNGGLGCYAVYASSTAEVILVGGTVNLIEPRNNNVFYVSNGGNQFDQAAVNTDNLTYVGTTVYLDGVEQTYSDSDVKKVSSVEDLTAAMAENCGYIVLESDVEAPLANSAIYGTPVAVIQKGGVIDGNGYSLDIENPRYEGYAIETYGGTIQNLVIDTEVGRGIVLTSLDEDVYITNVVIDGPGYAINTTEHGGGKLIVTNSTINGWTSFAGLDSASFTNCSFGENSAKYWYNNGYDDVYDRVIKPYVNTVFTNCDFTEGMNLDLSALGAGCTVTFVNCTVNGNPLTIDDMDDTPETYDEYFSVDLPDGRTLAECVIFE